MGFIGTLRVCRSAVLWDFVFCFLRQITLEINSSFFNANVRVLKDEYRQHRRKVYSCKTVDASKGFSIKYKV
jgi:hypothetical protein